MKNKLILITIFLFLVVSAIAGYNLTRNNIPLTVLPEFDGERAVNDVIYQVSLGPRIPTSQAHAEVVRWIDDELSTIGWETEFQEITVMGQPLVNIIGRRITNNKSDLPWIVIGAHYDSRIYADRDPDPELRSQAVPGANDGASGVATLLELGRVIPEDLPINIWLVFFDGEDNGNIPGWDWILGSRGFVEKLEGQPEAVVIVDMIGDSDLNIFFEKNSDPNLSEEIWSIANELGYSSQFIPFEKHRILDDHIPFLEAGIPSVDIIDFDYPAWHTTGDTVDKISSSSLKAVGDTLIQWLFQRAYGEGVQSP